MKIQVLVITMNNNFEVIEKMNISSDVVIANQGSENSVIFNDGSTKKLMVTTSTIGTSRNRNIALAHAFQEDELVLFSDDDLIFNYDYKETILNEFANHPEAEAIKFNLHDISSFRKITMKKIDKFKKATRRNMGSSGVCGLAIKQSVLNRINIRFNEEFGPGTLNYCGEDTIFIQEMINKKVRLFLSPYDIAGIDQTKSLWFKGYEEKYFFVMGKVLAVCYPKMCRLLALRSAIRFSRRKKCNFSFFQLVSIFNKGINSMKQV